MWTDYQRHRQSHNSPGSSGVFTDGIVFSLLHAGVFFRRLSVENHFDPFIYVRGDYTYLFSIFRISTSAFRVLLIGSSMSSI